MGNTQLLLSCVRKLDRGYIFAGVFLQTLREIELHLATPHSFFREIPNGCLTHTHTQIFIAAGGQLPQGALLPTQSFENYHRFVLSWIPLKMGNTVDGSKILNNHLLDGL